MRLLALGINHKTASLDLREKVAFTPECLIEALREGVREAGVSELAILSMKFPPAFTSMKTKRPCVT